MGLIPALKTFIPNTLILASEVNSNFEAIRAVVNGGIGSINLEDSSIATIAIQDGAVTNLKMAPDSVDEVNLVDGSVGEAKLASGAVTSNKIGDGEVSVSKIESIGGHTVMGRFVFEAGNVQTTRASENTVLSRGTGDIGFTKVSEDMLDDGSVTEDKLGKDSVTEDKIDEGAVTNVKVASGISASKLTTGTLPTSRLSTGAHNSNNVAPGQGATGAGNDRHPVGSVRFVVRISYTTVAYGSTFSDAAIASIISGSTGWTLGFEAGDTLPGTWQALSEAGNTAPGYNSSLPVLAVRVS